jgi:cytochrome P450
MMIWINVIEWIRQRDGKAFDFHGLMHRFTLESIARLAFGLEFDVIQKDRVQFAVDFDACTWSINNSMLDPFWLLKRYFTYEGWQYFAALNRINQFVSKIIAERRRTIAENGGKFTADMNDLLSLYLDKDTTNNTNNNMKDEDSQGSSLRDVVLNMIIAGRDTTAQALSWSFYRMCLHDGMQEKLRTEIIEVLKNTGEYEILRANNGLGSIAYDTLQQLKYVEAFIMEVLLLHPSVPKEAKCCFKDDILPDGTEVKKVI